MAITSGFKWDDEAPAFFGGLAIGLVVSYSVVRRRTWWQRLVRRPRAWWD